MLVTASCSSATPGGSSDGGAGGSDNGSNPAGGAEAGAAGGGDAEATTGSDGGEGKSDAGGAHGDSGVPITDAGTHDAGPTGPLVGSDHCASATVIPLTTVNSHVELMADTTAATHDVEAPCTADSGADVFYQFTVSKHVFLYADTFGASWNTVLFLLSGSCTPITTGTTAGDSVCNDTACGTSQSQIVALLAPGSYRLGLGGSSGATGAATIHFEFALAPSGASAPLPQGMSQQSGTTVGVSGNVNNQSSSCVAAGPENGYWWTSCPSDPGGQLTASTCGGATWETLLETEIPRSHPYACALDSCGMQTALSTTIPAGAGLHLLMIDGQAGTSAGAYTMQVNRP